MQVDLRRFDGFVTEPQREHVGIDFHLQKLQRSGAPLRFFFRVTLDRSA
jgi:hypothetical protein